MKRIFTLLTFLFLSNLIFAQGNVVKLNLTRLFTLKAELAYERTFLRQFSFQLGAATQIPMGRIPGANGATETVLDSLGISDMKYTGYWITPEFRIYLNPVKGAPKGTYLSFFGRFNNRIYNIKYRNNVEGGANFQDVEARFNISGTGGGLMIGHQWIIAKHVSIDFYIFGIGVNKHNALLKIADNRFSNDDYQTLANEINGDSDQDNGLFSKPKATAEGQSISVRAASVLPIIRSLGLNIGVAF